MGKSKIEIISYYSLDPETVDEVGALYGRVRAEEGILDPTAYSPDELMMFNEATRGTAMSHPVFYNEETLPPSIDQSDTIHYLAIQNSDRKSERIVGHAVIQSANLDYTKIWANGVRFLEPDLGSERTPQLWELGGAVVDPERQRREIWSKLIEKRLYDVSHELGGYAVSAVNQYRTDVMAKMAEFGGVVVGRSAEESDGALNLIVFPTLDASKLRYIKAGSENYQPVNSLSPNLLASEIDSQWVTSKNLGIPKNLQH